MSSPVSRGFRHLRRPSAGEEGRLPPGQYVTQSFPVLSAGPTPHTPLPDWTFSIRQGGDTLKSWTWQEFQALSAQTITVDIHCVTRCPSSIPSGGVYRWTRCWTRWPMTRPTCWTIRRTCRSRTSPPARRGWRSITTAGRSNPGSPARAAPVLLEEREMGAGPGADRSRPARFLGDLRLPHLWRPVAGTAVRGRLTWHVTRVRSVKTKRSRDARSSWRCPTGRGYRSGQHLDAG